MGKIQSLALYLMRVIVAERWSIILKRAWVQILVVSFNFEEKIIIGLFEAYMR